jgi:hypothetical protein
MSGDLSEAEREYLGAHLAECEECREAIGEFEAAVDVGVPVLAPLLTGTPKHDFGDLEQVRSSDREETEADPCAGVKARSFAFAHGNGHPAKSVSWSYVWLPFAACVLLSLALATYTYKAGKSRASSPSPPNTAVSANPRLEELEGQISDLGHDRELLKAQLGARDKTIADLRREIDHQSTSLAEMRSLESNLEQTIRANELDKQQARQAQNTLAQKLDAAEASLEKTQADLASMRGQQSQGEAKDASLSAEILDLNRQLRDREETINKEEDLLAHDRDIRDLMGARDLYIAEVYNVSGDGTTQKPCGRVFYTRGKSLVFYAYDLDQQPGARNGRTFQAWGRRGADMKDALNLGIFYQDSSAKKRWVVKFDNAETLEEIDAVFVTVEPSGGSHKPSGKPLLFAYLKIDPNHP